MKKSKILFISRAYPPTVGGIENQNYELSAWLGKIAEVKTIANRHGRKFLPFFAIYAAVYILINFRKYDALLLGDATLAILGWKIKLFSKKPVICVTHGLDLNWNSSSLGVWYEKILIKLYQNLWVKHFIPKLDKLIAVGNETIKTGVKLGIPKEKFVFIPNGIDPNKFLLTTTNRVDLEKIIGESIENKKFILTSGRLARRKGAAWFCRNIMPKLPENIIYIIAGDGPDRQNIEEAIKNNGLEKRVKMLGYVTDDVRDILFNNCDIFVQPNIKIPGDMEGFGISVIEAASCKIPVIVSNLEGLKDAIIDGKNGFLVESGNATSFIRKINELLADDGFRQEFGRKARQYVIENYSWEIISKRYLEEIEKACRQAGN